MSLKTYRIEDVKAVILVANRDFGRCPLATRLNRSLWPIGDRPVLQRLIEQISGQGVKKIVVCCRGDSGQIRAGVNIPSCLDVHFRDEPMPRGPAGCLRDTFESGDELIFVFHGCVMALPDLQSLMEQHRRSEAPMTVVFNPGTNGRSANRTSAQMYICESSIIDYIPPAGYCDIKEGLIPRLVQAGVRIAAVSLPASAGDFRHWREYLSSLYSLLSRAQAGDMVFDGYEQLPGRKDVLVGRDVQLDGSARLIGPVILSDRVRVGPDALIFGPSVIGPDVEIAGRAMISRSVVWERARIGAESRIENCLVDADCVIANNAYRKEQLLIRRRGLFAVISNWRGCLTGSGPEFTSALFPSQLFYLLGSRGRQFLGLVFSVILLAGVLWAYWTPTLENLWARWMGSDEYSSGILVPFLAGYVLWNRRERLLGCIIRPSLMGIVVLLAGQVLRLFGLVFMYSSLENLSLVVSLTGLVILIFGWEFFGRVWSILGYLLLMFPLPWSVGRTIALPLQEWATTSAIFCLETVGFQVIRRGNIVELNGVLVGVAEACNGLRMLTAFFVVSGFVILLSNRPRWQKLVVLVSSVPIALLCNTLRLAVTAAAFTRLDGQKWAGVFHDYGGLAMMPFALFLVAVELYFLSRLVVVAEEQPAGNMIFSRKGNQKQ